MLRARSDAGPKHIIQSLSMAPSGRCGHQHPGREFGVGSEWVRRWNVVGRRIRISVKLNLTEICAFISYIYVLLHIAKYIL